MQRSKRASVGSQTNLQPLLLGGASAGGGGIAGMSRLSEPGSASSAARSSKRDSGFSDIVGSFPITSANLRRISLRKSAVLDVDLETTTSPIYRLYPHQAANGDRRLRAMEDRSSSSSDTQQHHTQHASQHSLAGHSERSIATAIFAPLPSSAAQLESLQTSTQPPTPHALAFPVSHNDNDDVFELASSPVRDDFATTFTLPPLSRQESHDSFTSALSGHSPYQAAVELTGLESDLAENHLEIATNRDSRLQEQQQLLQPSRAASTALSASISFSRPTSQHSTVDQQETAGPAARLDQRATEELSASQDHIDNGEIAYSGRYTPSVSEQSVTGRYTPSLTNRGRNTPSTNDFAFPDHRTHSAQQHSIHGRYTPSLPDLRAPSAQDHRGRQPLETYKPRGFHLSGRASSASLRNFRSSSRASMGLVKMSSSGQIADIDDTPATPDTVPGNPYEVGDRSSAESVFSQETNATSLLTLPPLQSKGPDGGDVQHLEPLLEDDPRSFDLVEPAAADEPKGIYALEERADLMFSQAHLQGIFDNSKLLMRFTSFLNLHRPQSIPILIYYLDALKAIRAIKYANAIAEALEPISGQAFTQDTPASTSNTALEQKAQDAFRLLVEEDLPAYISYVWVQVVSTSIQRRITGTLAPHLREASEGLAETFCLTDPSRKDNPIVFASEEFARTTQYGMTYAIGRNCRFLQGPRTNPAAIRRLAIACKNGKESNEIFVNYRRDGSPFLNLLMTAPLMDSKGVVRYYIGAQVDVSGLLKGCSELPVLADLVEKQQDPDAVRDDDVDRDEFQDLTEMFNGAELDTVRKYGGRMHKEYIDDSDNESLADRRPRMVLKDSSQDIMEEELDRSRHSSISAAAIKEKINGKLEGVYQHYLLVRPAPSLRILFTSPSLRVPGILQSPFLHRIGGSARVRNDLAAALAEGRGVTAKIRWLARADEDGEGEGRARWIHCTPLLGHSGAVGVWMIVLVEEEGTAPGSAGGRRFRQAPPVADTIGGKQWDAKRPLTGYSQDLGSARRGITSTKRTSVATRTPVDSSQRAERPLPTAPKDSDSVIGEAVTAPSPDVPRGSRRANIIDFEDSPRPSERVALGGGSRNSSYASGHLIHQLKSNRIRSTSRGAGRGHSSASLFSVDLR